MTETKEKVAEKAYNKVLKEFIQPLMGKDTTYASQLEGAGRKLLGAKFRGVFPSDKIPKLNSLSKYAILNLDKSNEAGSHWVCIAYEQGNEGKQDLTYFYDSFNRRPREIIPNLEYTGNGRIVVEDNDIDQKIDENNCGQRCLSYLVVYDILGDEYAKYI